MQSPEIEMGQAEEPTLLLLSHRTLVGGCHIPCNVPGAYKDHLDKSLLSRDQWTWVLPEANLELRVQKLMKAGFLY